MYEARLPFSRLMRRQPVNQAIHRGNWRGLTRAILPRPTHDLTFEITTMAPEVIETQRVDVEAMNCGDCGIERFENRASLESAQFRQLRRPEHSPWHEIHDVEHGAGDLHVKAKSMNMRHGNVCVRERAQNAKLAINRVGRR